MGERWLEHFESSRTMLKNPILKLIPELLPALFPELDSPSSALIPELLPPERRIDNERRCKLLLDAVCEESYWTGLANDELYSALQAFYDAGMLSQESIFDWCTTPRGETQTKKRFFRMASA